jgi:hypothetical protein
MTRLASRIKRMEATHAPATEKPWHCIRASSFEDADQRQAELIATGKARPDDVFLRVIVTSETDPPPASRDGVRVAITGGGEPRP